MGGLESPETNPQSTPFGGSSGRDKRTGVLRRYGWTVKPRPGGRGVDLRADGGALLPSPAVRRRSRDGRIGAGHGNLCRKSP